MIWRVDNRCIEEYKVSNGIGSNAVIEFSTLENFAEKELYS